MEDYIYVNELTDKIVTSSKLDMTESGCRKVKFKSLITFGDTKPLKSKEMVGGFLTTKGVYCKRFIDPEIVERGRLREAMKNLDPTYCHEELRTIIQYIQSEMK